MRGFPKHLILIKLNGLYFVFLFTLLLPDGKRKETPCELDETRLWAKRYFGSTMKMLAKEPNYFDGIYV